MNLELETNRLRDRANALAKRSIGNTLSVCLRKERNYKAVVTGTILSANFHRAEVRGRSIAAIFEVVLEVAPNVRRQVFVRRLPV